jgi:SAM-dependent methyltransferase
MQEYTGQQFDLVVINDVMHHMFETRHRLRKSHLRSDVESFFAQLLKRVRPGGCVIISDVYRFGLRQMLAMGGVRMTDVYYESKQSPREWSDAANAAGWTIDAVIDYIPYRVSRIIPRAFASLVRYSISDRYQIVLRKAVETKIAQSKD